MADWRPGTSQQALLARAKLLASIRGFFAERGVVEVETPVLSGAGNSDPAISQFATRDSPARWLRTSPEYAMKRLLAAGSGDIYELGRVFRKGEAGRRHNPEFTLLEWYRVGWDIRRLTGEVAELVQRCGAAFERRWEVSTTTYRELFSASTGVDPLTAEGDELYAAARRHRIEVSEPDRLDPDAWRDLLMTHAVQPAMPSGCLTFVHDYPASQAALARIREEAPPVAERFELFIGGSELANGYFELTDPDELAARFEAENERRRVAGRSVAPLDRHLLEAMRHGLPEASGVALGVDRLLAACLDAPSLKEVLPFPFDRA